MHRERRPAYTPFGPVSGATGHERMVDRWAAFGLERIELSAVAYAALRHPE